MTAQTRRSRIVSALSDRDMLRALVLAANDGIIATAGLLEGFAGAGASDAVLVVAAIVATVTGAIALGGAEWAEASAARDAEQVLIADERARLAADPEDELDELTAYWVSKGLDDDLARRVAEQLSARDALAAQLDYEHGIEEPIPASGPLRDGVRAAIGFILGAAIPLLITVFVPVQVESFVVLAAVAVSLTATSFIAARFDGTPVWRVLVRTLTVGIGTIVLSYAAGSLLF